MLFPIGSAIDWQDLGGQQVQWDFLVPIVLVSLFVSTFAMCMRRASIDDGRIETEFNIDHFTANCNNQLL